MSRILGVVLVLLPVALCGCAGNPYQSYPDSLYAALYENTPEALGEHETLLEEILVWYDQEGQIAPPGVAAELAFYQARLGQTDRVEELLRREVATYPESELFVGALRRFLLGPESAPIFEREEEGEQDKEDDDAEDR